MKLFNKNQRGQVGLGNLVPIVVTFAVAIVVTSLVAGVIGDIRADQDDGLNETDFNISGEGLTAYLNLAGQYPNIGTVLAIVVIVGLLVGAFAAFRQ